jgi:hypothetical protein
MANSSFQPGGGLDAVVDDTSPQAGGDFDLLTQKITTTTPNGDIMLDAIGTGSVVFQNDASTVCEITDTGLSFDGGTNNLDAYEVGTLTIGAEDSSSNASSTTALGNYTRIGNIVFVSGNLTNISTAGLTGTDDIIITGLPITSAALSTAQYVDVS